MGRGGAQLGKAVKGKSKERRRDKKSKLKETVTEKQLGEDIKMLEEYEKMNKLAEAQRVRLKKLCAQETYNTRINKKLLLNIHRKLMRVEKVDALRKEIEILAQNHERDVDRKDAIIVMLSKDLDDAEEQFQTAQRSHMAQMNALVTLHHQKLAAIEAEFERDLKALKLELHTESAALIAQHSRETREMNGIIAAVEAEEADRITEAKQAHETEREEIRNKNLEGINELRINLENKIEDLEKQFDEAHTSYVKNTESANKHFKELKENDARMSLEIFEKKKKIIRFQNNLAYWKKKIEYNHRECVARNAALGEQKEAIQRHCNALKQRMSKLRANEAKRLTELTGLSRTALKANQSRLEKAEQILQLAELSRKMETEKEKVMPFYQATVLPQDAKGTSKSLANAQDEKEAEAPSPDRDTFPSSSIPTTAYTQDGEPVPEWGYLENFHKKSNKVLLDTLAIKQEKARLQKENADLRAILKQYLDGIAITEDVVDHDNPLLIVNGRINLLSQTQLAQTQIAGSQVRRVTGGRPTVMIEASQVVSNYTTHGYAAR